MFIFPFIIIINFFLIKWTKLSWDKNKNDIVFWISFMFFFDPGGFFSGYTNGDVIGRIKSGDVFFLIMILTFINSKKRAFHLDNEIRSFIKLLCIVSLYFLLVYGILVPLGNNYFDFSFFIQKNRQYFFAIPILIFCYHFSLRSISIFFTFLVFYSLIILVLYLLTIATTLSIVPVQTWSRFGTNDRVSMISYGLIHWIAPLGLVVLSLGKILDVKYKKLIVSSMFLMIVTYILTLTRREYSKVIFMAVIIPLFISFMSSHSIFLKIKKFILPLILTVTIITFMFPKYVVFSADLVKDLYLTLSTGKDSQGNIEERVAGTGDLLIVKHIISDNLFFGIGYYPAQWSDVIEMKATGNKLGIALDASSEVPIYGAFMRLGILGLLTPLFLYILLIRKSIDKIKLVKKGFNNLYKKPYSLVIFLTMTYLLISIFSIESFTLFGDFYNPYGLPILCAIIGILFGCFRNLSKVEISKQ